MQHPERQQMLIKSLDSIAQDNPGITEDIKELKNLLDDPIKNYITPHALVESLFFNNLQTAQEFFAQHFPRIDSEKIKIIEKIKKIIEKNKGDFREVITNLEDAFFAEEHNLQNTLEELSEYDSDISSAIEQIKNTITNGITGKNVIQGHDTNSPKIMRKFLSVIAPNNNEYVDDYDTKTVNSIKKVKDAIHLFQRLQTALGFLDEIAKNVPESSEAIKKIEKAIKHSNIRLKDTVTTLEGILFEGQEMDQAFLVRLFENNNESIQAIEKIQNKIKEAITQGKIDITNVTGHNSHETFEIKQITAKTFLTQLTENNPEKIRIIEKMQNKIKKAIEQGKVDQIEQWIMCIDETVEFKDVDKSKSWKHVSRLTGDIAENKIVDWITKGSIITEDHDTNSLTKLSMLGIEIPGTNVQVQFDVNKHKFEIVSNTKGWWAKNNLDLPNLEVVTDTIGTGFFIGRKKVTASEG